jgi:hypothetical protein
VLFVPLTGRDRGTAEPVSQPLGLTDVVVSPITGLGWGIGSQDATLYRELPDGSGGVEPILSLPEYQATDPDPVDQEGAPEESNPFGLAALPNGDILVADAAGNDIVRVSPEGVPTTMARFDVETVSTDHLPPGFELEPGVPVPPTIDAEAVPTSIAVLGNGDILVGELKGFPFRPGSSNIWRIDGDAEGAFCSVAGSTGGCELYDTGYTGIADIAVNQHNGRLYVYEFAEEGVLAFEEGLDPENGVFPPAVLLEVKRNGQRRELAAGQLSQPGGVAVAFNGQVFVTDNVFTGGRLLRVR